MTSRVLITAGLFVIAIQSRPPDLPFRVHTIDPGASETAAVADINRDGRLDVVSGEYWYQAPAWTKHRFREVGFASNYIDSFSLMPIDVNGDGYPDIADVSWFARKIAWWKNPGKAGRAGLWEESEISGGGNVEFAVLADIDNDGKALEIVAQQNGTPQAWFEVRNGSFVKHVVSDRTYGHGIGAGDVNKDGRNDILTPRGWLEAPADPRSPNWMFHADWEVINQPPAAAVPPAPQGGPPASPPGPPRVLELGFMHVVDVNGDGRNDVVTAAGHDFGVFWFEQRADGTWTRRNIDNAWSQGHASTLVDINRDGRLDLVTGKRFMAHNGTDPGEREPLGLYWYEFRPASAAAGIGPAATTRQAPTGQNVEWIRHVIEYGGRVGGGMQIPVVVVDGDGDLDLVCAGKSGLFFVENLSGRASAARPTGGS
jgi:hypothetical protein